MNAHKSYNLINNLRDGRRHHKQAKLPEKGDYRGRVQPRGLPVVPSIVQPRQCRPSRILEDGRSDRSCPEIQAEIVRGIEIESKERNRL